MLCLEMCIRNACVFENSSTWSENLPFLAWIRSVWDLKFLRVQKQLNHEQKFREAEDVAEMERAGAQRKSSVRCWAGPHQHARVAGSEETRRCTLMAKHKCPEKSPTPAEEVQSSAEP